MRLKNLNGPSGVPLGGCGTGFYEIDPRGRVTRNCVNNIHRSFLDSRDGFIVGVYDGSTAVRLQRDEDTVYGMEGYRDSFYTGLWPRMDIDLENSLCGASSMGFSAMSGMVAHNVKLSSLPAVFYEVRLNNDGDCEKNMSAMLTWGDIIGKGIRDTDAAAPTNYDGETSEWRDMPAPLTYSKGACIKHGNTEYMGIHQYSKVQLLPKKATFQNYNNSFLILAEKEEDSRITVLNRFDTEDKDAFSSFLTGGELNEYNENEAPLSTVQEDTRKVESGSAVCVSVPVKAHSTRCVRFMLCWFMPEITEEQYSAMNKMPGCDYNRYYHNYFSSVFSLAEYAVSVRDEIREGILRWQKPLLESSLPDWLSFKIINSGYTLYTNGVLNKRGNFSALEGQMGGLGGTMDQKMSSHPFYEKLLPTLNLEENRQFANVTGADGEIQHFDLHYYHGMSDSDPNNKVNPAPAGSMIDNSGSWMVQMYNYYSQTGDSTYLHEYYDIMKTSMDFIESKYAKGTHFPNYYTTYDDYSHPEILIFTGIVWLNMLDIAADWARLEGDTQAAEKWEREYTVSYADVQKLYGEHEPELGINGYYAFGSDSEYIASDRKSGSIKSEIMFSGAMAGQFISRYSGRKDLIPFDSFVSHMNAFLRTSVQASRDYLSPKVYNMHTDQDLDIPGSRCWPFYLDSYGGMAAIKAGYLEDGLEILKHTMQVELRLGYMWTQNLWNRAYETYMTIPVSWFISDVLAGSALSVPEKSITLGPVCPAKDDIGSGDILSTTVYYPKFWARIDYRPKENIFTYTVTDTFYNESDAPIVINKVVALPGGTAFENAVTISLSEDFTVTKGAVLELSPYISSFSATVLPKRLEPVGEYITPVPEKIADGTGLSACVLFGGKKHTFTAPVVNFRFTKDAPPAEGADGDYCLTLSGKLLPRYSQKYQLIFEYTGEISVSLGGKPITEYSDSISDVESQQFVPTEGCKLMVCTTELAGGELTDIEISYKGDMSAGDNILRFLWWSTTQNMGVVIKERLYPQK